MSRVCKEALEADCAIIPLQRARDKMATRTMKYVL